VANGVTVDGTEPDRRTVFIASGGGRGITARALVGLARVFHSRFILVGRTSIDDSEPEWARGALDEPEAWRGAEAAIRRRQGSASPVAVRRELGRVAARREVLRTLSAIEEAGGAATYLQADVSDRAALRTALAGALTAGLADIGIIHGAGVLADRPIGQKVAADFETVYAPKVDGLRNLLACFAPEVVRYLVLFASAAGFYGNPGQADYALANEVLNKLAYRAALRLPRCRVLSFNWGPWDGGMVSPGLKAQFAERGIALIAPDEGARVLVEEVARPTVGTQILVGQPFMPEAVPVASIPTRQRVRRRVAVATNPFLRDHVFNRTPVLPVMTALAWLIDVCEGLYPGYWVHAWSDFRVLKGLVFDANEPEEFAAEVARVETPEHPAERIQSDPRSVHLDAVVQSTTPDGRTRPHYAARLVLAPRSPEAPVRPPPHVIADGGEDGQRMYADGTLFHGPSFRGIRRVLLLTPTAVVLECRVAAVAERDQGQFPVRSFNYFAADLAVQSMVVWLRRFRDLRLLPLHIAAGESYRSMPFEATLYVSTTFDSHDDSAVRADMVIQEPGGAVLARFSGVEGIISPRLTEMFRLTTIAS
jgi:NAD(P)-dependent dehydrogenase (short-subunit alcohol dehydrogenase family)